MSRDSKKKLAIVAGLSECLVYAEAKYCAFEIHGEPKYYVCPRTEYCCNFGCCVSPGFQIYHLWYYWLLVIIMFLVCSGGGWWYRYWLQGRYRAAASAIPSRGPAGSRGQSALPGRTCPAQQASITYNSARNTVLLHRMWKGGPHRGPGSSPAYTGPPVAAAASSAHFQNTSVVLNDVNCPYYQLYGPPPSYETVIAQTRGKLSSPLSPERSRNVDLSSSATGSSSTLQNQDVASRFYNHHSPYNNNHPSQTAGTLGGVDSAISCYEEGANVVDTINRLDDSLEASSGLSRYAPSYASNADGTTPVHTAGRQNACLPLHYHGGPIPPLDYGEDNAAIVPDTYRIYRDNSERLPSYQAEINFIDTRTTRVNATSSSSSRDHHRPSSQLLAGESHSSVPDLKIEGNGDHARGTKTPRGEQRNERYSRNHGGSLKLFKPRDDELTFNGSSSRRGKNFHEIESSSRPVVSTENSSVVLLLDKEQSTSNETNDFGDKFSRSTRKGALAKEKGRTSDVIITPYDIDHQTNPSDNVILEPLTSVNINEPNDDNGPTNDEASSNCWRTRRHDDDDDDEDEDEDDDDDDDEKRRRRVPSPGARGTNNDEQHFVEAPINNHESKHNKLDRSKSLD